MPVAVGKVLMFDVKALCRELYDTSRSDITRVI